MKAIELDMTHSGAIYACNPGLYKVKRGDDLFFVEIKGSAVDRYAKKWRAIETPTGYASRYERRCELTKALELGPSGYISVAVFDDMAAIAEAQWLVKSYARLLDVNVECCHSWGGVPLRKAVD